MTANPAQNTASNGSEMYRVFLGHFHKRPSTSYYFSGTWHAKEQTAAAAGNGELGNKGLVTQI